MESSLPDQPETAFNSNLQRWDYKMDQDQTDLVKVMEEFKVPFKTRLAAAKQQFRAIRATLIVTIEYKSRKHPANEPFLCIYEVQWL